MPRTTTPTGFHDASAPAPSLLEQRRVIAALAGFGVLVFAISMAAMFPARLLAGRFAEAFPAPVAGTVWSASTSLPNGDRISLKADPLASLASLSWVAKLSIEGPATALAGQVSTRGRTVTISGLNGRTDWQLIRAMSPDLSLDCDVRINLVDAGFTLNTPTPAVSGSASSDAGACKRDGSARWFDLPATSGTSEITGNGSTLRLAPASDPATLLLEATLAGNGSIIVTITPDALTLASGKPTSGPVVYELRAR